MTTHGPPPRPLPAGPAGTTFIGSFIEGPGQALLLLQGDIDGPAVDRVDAHIDAFCDAGMHNLVIDAAAVDSYDAALLALLGRTQRRLGRRRGLLRVRGLHPSHVPDPTPTPDPGPAPTLAPTLRVVNEEHPAGSGVPRA